MLRLIRTAPSSKLIPKGSNYIELLQLLFNLIKYNDGEDFIRVLKMYQVLEQAKVIWEANSELINFCQIKAPCEITIYAPPRPLWIFIGNKANYNASKENMPLINRLKNMQMMHTVYKLTLLLVGEDFSNRHCYFELIGPKGHFYDEKIRVFICYWGEHLNYKWHSHEAEEMYYILGGKAQFRTRDHEKNFKGR